MKAARLSLALLMLAVTQAAFAEPPPAPEAPLPRGSPGNWIGSGDYPATALRFNMEGTTVFKLTVDAAGKPQRCEVVESSGFDILDTTTCQRLMANAKFSPSRDRAGKPIEGAFSSRVRWVMPQAPKLPVSERFASMALAVDPSGNITACQMVVHVPTEAAAPNDSACKQVQQSRWFGWFREFSSSFQGAPADVEIEMAAAFSPALRARILSPKPGYEQRGLSIHRFTVTSEGKLGQCTYEELRGSDLLATNFCLEASREAFDPPFSAFDKDGVATGWQITRVLVKTGK